jgi:carbon-monoxide dehydrogenase large subunit
MPSDIAKFGLGHPVTRYEDATLATGKGQYTDDVRTTDSAFGYALRSSVAHAVIEGLDTAAARNMPGVLTIMTDEDMTAAGVGDIPCFVPLENKDGSARHDTPRPVLARGRVRYVGEPIAFVVAETYEQAHDAAEAINVDYQMLPAVTGSRAATAAGAPQLHEAIANNVIYDWQNGDPVVTDKAFAGAHHVTSIDLVNNRVAAVSMEPRNAVAEWSAGDSRVNLYTGTQGVHFVRDQLMDGVLQQDKDKVRVIFGNVGGGFGMKAFVYPEHVLTTLAAQQLQRTVRWQSDRSEAFLSDNHGRAHQSKAEVALDKDGHFLAVRVTTYADMGAYLSPFGCFVPTGSSDLVVGLYKTPAISINVKGIATNTTPVCAYRGAGRPEASYLMERLVDAAARDIGLSQDEIRRRNLIPPEALPYAAPLNCTYDSGEFAAMMEAAMVKADWSGFNARRTQSEANGKLRGIGMST